MKWLVQTLNPSVFPGISSTSVQEFRGEHESVSKIASCTYQYPLRYEQEACGDHQAIRLYHNSRL